jgi:surfactin synthase thioesterase subunit
MPPETSPTGTTQPVPVLCLPHAGAGAAFFRSWLASTPQPVALRPIQLPGREELIDEDPYTDIGSALIGLLPGVLEVLSRPAAVALFGHSLGAVLAYEVARHLQCQPGIRVQRLFVSGSPAPHLGRSRRATGLDDTEFLDRVLEFAEYRHPAFDIPELRELILPTLRADVRMHEDYRPLPGAALTAPITCFRGIDDELVSAAEADAWREATAGDFELIELPGGHMFVSDDCGPLLRVVGARLAGLASAVPVSAEVRS